MKTLIFVRHGNTFREGETPTRVGCRTDLELVETARSENAARIISERGFTPTKTFSSPLKRTIGTAKIILDTMGLKMPITPLPIFSEIDYGEDENRTEHDVLLRLGKFYLAQEGVSGDISIEKILARGKQAIELWDKEAIPPAGWQVDTEKIIQDLRNFADGIEDGETVLVVSSNGIIRFAPHILAKAAEGLNLKIPTGGVCIFQNDGAGWVLAYGYK